MQRINSPQVGDLAGLLKSPQQGGLGEAANSRVSTGQKMPVSADQIQSSPSDSRLPGLAAQRRITPEQASGSLAQYLPQIIDQRTPDDQLPQHGPGDFLSQGLEMLKKGGLFS